MYPGTLPSPRAASLGQGPPLCRPKYGYLDTRVLRLVLAAYWVLCGSASVFAPFVPGYQGGRLSFQR
eukprot:1046960-Rhodomonas_salina.1